MPPLVLEAPPPAGVVDPAVRQLRWERRSVDGRAVLRQRATSVGHCELTCVVQREPRWHLSQCAGTDTDFAFVASDCSAAVVLFEYPKGDVGLLFEPEVPPLSLRLTSFMADPTQVDTNGPRFRWLGGVLDKPGSAPSDLADGSGVEFDTVDGQHHRVAFPDFRASPPPPVAADAPAPEKEEVFYQWTDARGGLHVGPLSEVPERSRKRATPITAELMVVPAAPKPATPQGVAHVDPRTKALEVAQEESTWRGRFAAARQQMALVERQLAEARATVQELDGAVVHGRQTLTPAGVTAYEAAKAVLNDAERARQQAQDAAHELNRQAANAAVPLEWRR